jgi:N-dimethyltransferase
MIDPYKFYASDYDVGTTTNIAATTDLIKCSVKKYNPYATTMLELASGTGNVIERLMHDFDMTGIDLSPAMIEVAQKKLPNIEMHVADMT